MSEFKRVRPLTALAAVMIAMVGAASLAFANLSANPIIVEFTDGQAERQDIKVKNDGERTQYVEITPFRITAPGEADEHLVTDPDPAKVGLLVAPRRMTLNPGEEKVIRVIRLPERVTADRAWRVEIKPLAGEIQGTKSGAVVQLGYRALVFVRPAAPRATIEGRRNGTHLVLRNTGNTNATLARGKQCPPGGAACVDLGGRRLWPGASWDITLPATGPVTFGVFGPNGETPATF